MPATRTQTKFTPLRAGSVYLVGGADEFTIKETAAKLASNLAPKGAGEFGVEIIEGDATNQDEALKIIGRLREALDTVGLFGGGEKLVWLKNTNLLADTQTTRAEAVKESLLDFADTLKRGLPDGVTLLISAIGCDRRKTAELRGRIWTDGRACCRDVSFLDHHVDCGGPRHCPGAQR